MMRGRLLRLGGGYGALFALALQLGLAFGHLHLLLAATGPADVAAAMVRAGKSEPAKHSGNGAQDICAICVTIQLAGTTVLPPPAPLVVPVATYTVVAFGGSHFVLPRLPRHPFQTRAPPAA